MVWVIWLSLRQAKEQAHGRFDSKIFESANLFQIKSDGRFKLESRSFAGPYCVSQTNISIEAFFTTYSVEAFAHDYNQIMI